MTSRFGDSIRPGILWMSLWFLAGILPSPALAEENPLSTVFVRASEPDSPSRLAIHWTGNPAATVSVWLDVNGDGVWQDFEQVVREALLAEEMTLFDVASPTGMELVPQTQMRLRVSIAGKTLQEAIRSIEGSGPPAGCWASDFHVAGMDARVSALAIFDDGDGAALYAGGNFTTAAGQVASRIAKWDGVGWAPLGSGIDGPVNAFTLFDDGSGSALYAGGDFTMADGVGANHIAKWDGASWSPLGTGMNAEVRSLTVFEDGSGTALYVGGDFTTAGGVSASRIAKWDGASWSPLGGGTDASVLALAPFDDGSGPALYAAGVFVHAGSIYAAGIAAWDGASWSALGDGLEFCDEDFGCGDGHGHALKVWDDGGGPALYVGGSFTHAGGGSAANIARWNGVSWSALAGGRGHAVFALATFDDGGGTELYAGSDFNGTGGNPMARIGKWDGSAWTALSTGADEGVYAFTVFDVGTGPRLYIGGDFTSAGDASASRIATWDGSMWSALDTDAHGLNNQAGTFATYDDGSGAALYAGGFFNVAGDTSARQIAKWDGAEWSPLGSGIGNGHGALVLAVFDDGQGPELYVGGSFFNVGGVAVGRIAKWDGATWSDVGGGTGSGSDRIYALAVFDDGDGPALYAGGDFTSIGGLNIRNIAKWDGASWSTLGTGTNGEVFALTTFDDGNGSALYAGGRFTNAGGVSTSRIAQWDGAAWAALGSGIGETSVATLATFDDGQGAALYAGGVFTTAGGVSASGIARWNGASWSALGNGVSGSVSSMAVFSNGNGPELYVGGSFTSAGGLAANHIAKWDGTMWSPLDDAGSMNDSVTALAVHDDGSGSALYAGGNFTTAGGTPSSFIGRYTCSLFADGFESGDLSAWSTSIP